MGHNAFAANPRVEEVLRDLEPEACPIEGRFYRQGMTVGMQTRAVALAYSRWRTQPFCVDNLVAALVEAHGSDKFTYSSPIAAAMRSRQFTRVSGAKYSRKQTLQVSTAGVSYLRSKTEPSGMGKDALSALELNLLPPAPTRESLQQLQRHIGASLNLARLQTPNCGLIVALLEEANELRGLSEGILARIPASHSGAWAAFSVCFSTLNAALKTLALALSGKTETVAALEVCITSLNDTMRALKAALAQYNA